MRLNIAHREGQRVLRMNGKIREVSQPVGAEGNVEGLGGGDRLADIERFDLRERGRFLLFEDPTEKDGMNGSFCFVGISCRVLPHRKGSTRHVTSFWMQPLSPNE